jgi:signal transduction histidine kinase
MNPDEPTQRLASFPKTNPNPVMEFAADGTLTFCNAAGSRLADLLGAMSPTAIMPAEIKAIIAECVASGESKMDLRSTMANHTLSWSFVPAPDRKFVHCYGADITERLDLEAQLLRSVKMEAVGQLAAGMAHDFNNILTIIQGHAELLMQTHDLPVRNHNSVRQIAATAERASQLIHQLLVFSRKQVMQQRLLNLNDVIQNITPVLRGLAGEQVVLEFRPDPDLLPLCADASMIEQALINLTINACDAMAGGGHLVVSTSRQVLEPAASASNPEAHPGSFVCLTVTDSGCGMDARTLSHVFEPFFTTKEPGKGTGLGLASVYGIVKQHQGWVTAESRVGHGSTFTLFLPSAVTAARATPAMQPAPAPPPAIAPAPDETATAMPRGNETILVVEDEPALRELVVKILEMCGYHIIEAASGVEALEVWAKHKGEIDLLLTDMVMPGGVSGRQLGERLTAEEPGLKVIYTVSV